MATLDTFATLAVASAALGGRPLRRRLRIGALIDLARAVAVVTVFTDAPRSGRSAVIAGSLAGAALSAVLVRYVE